MARNAAEVVVKFVASGLDNLRGGLFNLGRGLSNLRAGFFSLVSVGGVFSGITSKIFDTVGAIRDLVTGVDAGDLALSGLGAIAVRQAIQFETAFAPVQRVVEGTREQFRQLELSLQGLTRVIPLTAGELSEAAKAAGQVGVAIEEIPKFVEIIAKLSTALELAPGDTTREFGKLKDMFGLNVEQVRLLGDAVALLDNESTALASEIVELTRRIAGSSKAFGLTSRETAALATTMVALSVPIGLADTAVRDMLVTLQTGSVGTADFKRALGALGLTAEGVAKSIRENPQQALLDLLGTLEELAPQSRQEFIKLLFGQQNIENVAKLVGKLDTYRRLLELVKDPIRFAGTAQRDFGAVAATSEISLTLAANAVRELGEDIGKSLLPTLKLVVGAFTVLTQGIDNFVKAFPGLVQVGVIVGTITVATIGLRAGLFLLRGVLSALGISLKEVAAAFGQAFLFATGGIVVAGVSRLGGAIAALRGAFALLFPVLTRYVIILTLLLGLWEEWSLEMVRVGTETATFGEVASATFSVLKDNIVESVDIIEDWVTSLLGLETQTTKTTSKGKAEFGAFFELLRDVGSFTITGLLTLFVGLGRAIIAVAESIPKAFSSAFSSLGKQITALDQDIKSLTSFDFDFSNVRQATTDSVDEAGNLFEQLASRIGKGFTDAEKEATEAVAVFGERIEAKLRERRAAVVDPETGRPSKGGRDVGLGDEDAAEKAKKAAREALALLKVQVDSEVALTKDANERIINDLENSLELRKISYRKFYQEKVKFEQDSIDSEIDSIQTLLRQASLEATERERLETELTLLRRKRADVSTQAARDEAEAEKRLTDTVLDLQARLLEARGKQGEARALQLEAELRPIIEQLQRDPARAEDVKIAIEVLGTETARLELEDLYATVRRLQEELSIRQQRIQTELLAGLISEADARREVARLQGELADKISVSLPKMQALAAAFGEDEILRVAAIKQEMERLGQVVDETAVTLNTRFQEAAGSAFKDFILGVKDANSAIASFGEAVIDAVADILAQQAALALLGGTPQGGGIGGILSFLFGQSPTSLLGGAAGGNAAVGTAGGGGGGPLFGEGKGVFLPPVESLVPPDFFKGILDGITSLFTGPNGIGSLFTSLFSGLGSVFAGLFHQGGIVASAGSPRRAVSALAFLNAPRLHSGGVMGLRSNEIPAILKKGEEVVTETDPRHARNLAQPVVHMTVISPDAGSFRRSESQIVSDLGIMLDRVNRRTR